MAAPSLFASAAHRWARARRWLLLGNPAPFLARYAPADLPTPDVAADGEVAVRVWARWRAAEHIEAGLAALTSIRIDRGGTPMGIPRALGEAAIEPDRDTAAALLRGVGRLVRRPGLELGSAFARATDFAAERGAPQLMTEAELDAASQLLAITEEPVRDVLTWASLRAGRPRRAALTLADGLRALRNQPLDGRLHPARDPWPALIAWREPLGLGFAAATELATGPEAWLGSWALRGQRSRLVGASGWPGVLRARFALQGLGRLEALSEGGYGALLPQDPAAAQLLAATYPMLLSEVGFLKRVFASGGDGGVPDADAARLVALSELLLQRVQAAVVQLWGAFEQSREVGAVLDAAGMLSRALYAAVPTELALLLAAPWTEGSSAPPAVAMAAAAQIEGWRESFDEDFWRNPRIGEPLRSLASRSPRESLAQLVPEVGTTAPEAYARWVEASLGK